MEDKERFERYNIVAEDDVEQAEHVVILTGWRVVAIESAKKGATS